MKKKTIGIIIVWLLLISGVIVFAEVFIDDKSGTTIYNCESCYNNYQIGFDYKGNHYIIPRYDIFGDRLQNKTQIAQIAENFDRRGSRPLPFIIDTDSRLRVMESVK